MKHINVPFTAAVRSDSPMEDIASFLSTIERHDIAIAPWPLPGKKPQVQFAIAHTGDAILLRYTVAEEYVRAVNKESNDPVYEDSCVEFFISPDNNSGYYNFEFNSLEACLMGYGNDLNTREYQPPALISKIRRKAVTINEHADNGLIPWELTLVFPLEVFAHHTIATLTGRECTANFYKCGDKLPHPHYLAWNNIETPQPDFHRPEFFGRLIFQPEAAKINN